MGVETIGEQGLRQLTQVELQKTTDGIYINISKKRIRFQTTYNKQINQYYGFIHFIDGKWSFYVYRKLFAILRYPLQGQRLGKCQAHLDHDAQLRGRNK